MKLSLIIPTYRRPESARACLAAVLAGDALPDEVVVVTREGDAASREVAERFREQAGGRVAVKHALVERPGQPAALNEGVKAATGDVLVFIDDDVLVHRDWLSRVRRHFEDPKVGGVGGRDIVLDDGVERPLKPVGRVGEVTWYGRVCGNHWRPVTFTEPRAVQHLKGANMAFRREFVAEFDERFIGAPSYNDTDISLSAVARGARLIYDPQAQVDHHGAARPFAGGRDEYHPENVVAYTHNKNYGLLKRLSPARRWAFMLFSLLVGQGQAFGLLKTAAACVTRGPRFALRTFRASMRGHVAAYRTYRRWRRESEEGRGRA
jgi:GT2 family glycosyltransferase